MKVEIKYAAPVDEGLSIVDQAWQQAASAIGQARKAVESGARLKSSFEWARTALESLPISQQEFALAKNRLHNAESYYSHGETGAAVFELNLLSGGLSREARWSTTPTRKKSRS